MAANTSPTQEQGCSEEDVDKQQMELLWEKYGALAPKVPPRLLAKKQSKKCFDSADWSMSVQKQKQGGSPQQAGEATLADLLGLRAGSTEMLPAKLSPSPPPPRRLSNLGDK